jgi:hypothetical protein
LGNVPCTWALPPLKRMMHHKPGGLGSYAYFFCKCKIPSCCTPVVGSSDYSSQKHIQWEVISCMGFKLQILIQDGGSNNILNIGSSYFWYLILSQDTQHSSASFQSSPNTIHHFKNLIMSFPLSFEVFQSNTNLPSIIALRIIENRLYLEICEMQKNVIMRSTETEVSSQRNV